jgi:hypothetical protein
MEFAATAARLMTPTGACAVGSNEWNIARRKAGFDLSQREGFSLG